MLNSEFRKWVYYSGAIVRWLSQVHLPPGSNQVFPENIAIVRILTGYTSLSVPSHQISDGIAVLWMKKLKHREVRSRSRFEPGSFCHEPSKAWYISTFSLISSLEQQFPTSQDLKQSWVPKLPSLLLHLGSLSAIKTQSERARQLRIFFSISEKQMNGDFADYPNLW